MIYGEKMIDINTNIPLSERMRPKTLDEFIGQEHIVGKNMLLRRAIECGMVPSCIFMVLLVLAKQRSQGLLQMFVKASLRA